MLCNYCIIHFWRENYPIIFLHYTFWNRLSSVSYYGSIIKFWQSFFVCLALDYLNLILMQQLWLVVMVRHMTGWGRCIAFIMADAPMAVDPLSNICQILFVQTLCTNMSQMSTKWIQSLPGRAKRGNRS